MMKFDDKNFIASQIKLHRRKKGLTQEELAEKADLSVQHVSRIETGCYFPSLKSFFLIAEALDMDLKIFGFNLEKTENDKKNNLIDMISVATNSELILYEKLLQAAKSSLDAIKMNY